MMAQNKRIRRWREIEIKKNGEWITVKGIVSNSFICARKCCNRKITKINNRSNNRSPDQEIHCSPKCAARSHWNHNSIADNIKGVLRESFNPLTFLEIKKRTGHGVKDVRRVLKILVRRKTVTQLGVIANGAEYQLGSL